MTTSTNGITEIFSALYVDFDNIYTRLHENNADAASTFAMYPYKWMSWVNFHALKNLYGENVKRRILKKTVYLNPDCYQQYRNPFTRSAFRVVDCPPLTSRGKTSTDVHLIMDCMDDLNHKTFFDEFIILSGDADFTPLLIRLSEHARRTLILSVGYSSPAYTSAASWIIRDDWFIQQALLNDNYTNAYKNIERMDEKKDYPYSSKAFSDNSFTNHPTFKNRS